MARALAIALLALVALAAIPLSTLAESRVTTLLVVPTGKLALTLYFPPDLFVSVVSRVSELNATVTLYTSTQSPGFVNSEVVIGTLMNGTESIQPELLEANVSAPIIERITEYFLRHGVAIFNSTNSSEISYCLSTLSSGRALLMLYNVSGALVGKTWISALCNLSSSTTASIYIDVPAQLNGSRVTILWGDTPVAQGFGGAPPVPRLVIQIGVGKVLEVWGSRAIPVTVVRVGRDGYEEYVSAYMSLSASMSPPPTMDARAIVVNGSVVLSLAAVVKTYGFPTEIWVEPPTLLPREVDVLINGSSVEVYVPIEAMAQFMGSYYRVYVARLGRDLAVVSVRDLANMMRSTVWIVGRNSNVSLNDLVSAAMPGALLSPQLSFAYIASVPLTETRYEIGVGRCISVPIARGINMTVCRERFVELASFEANLSKPSVPYYLPSPITSKVVRVPIYLAIVSPSGVTISPITVTRTVTTATLPSELATLTRANLALAILAVAMMAIALALLLRRKSAVARY